MTWIFFLCIYHLMHFFTILFLFFFVSDSYRDERIWVLYILNFGNTECSLVPSDICTGKLDIFTITTFRTFCHLSVICVFTVTSKLGLSKIMELTREKFRAMIYYNLRRRLSRQVCIDQLISTFGDETPSYDTMKRWYNEFNLGRHSLTDEFRKGRPKSVVVPENINAVQKLIMQDRHVTYCEIEATLGISSTSIYKILHEYLAVLGVRLGRCTTH